LLYPLILLTGCRASPNIERVTDDTNTQLQHELTKDYSEKNATVQKVSLVQTTAPKYEGEATIAFDNSTFTVPLAVYEATRAGGFGASSIR
jgi:hypothetical protein